MRFRLYLPNPKVNTNSLRSWLVIFLGLLIYLRSLLNGFVWDDDGQIVTNGVVHSLVNFPRFFLGSTFDPGGTGQLHGIYYKPLLSFFFSLIYTFVGSDPLFFHLFQVLLHVVNSLLVFVFFRVFFKRTLAFLLTLVFLIHPLQVEAVSYISALQDTLFFFFGMCALLASRLKRKKIVLPVTGFLLLCSLLSKETGLLFLPIVVLYHLLVAKKYIARYIVICFLVLIVYGFLRFVVADVPFRNVSYLPISSATVFERAISMPKIFSYYVANYFFPKDMAIAQHWVIKKITLQDFYLPILVFVFFSLCIFLLWYRVRHKRKEYAIFLFFFTWLLLGMGFHMQIFPLSMTVADRWFYLPMVPLLGLIGIGITQGRFLFRPIPKIVLACFIGLSFAALIIRTEVRISNWRDNFTLYSHDIILTKDSFDIENGLGVELFKKGDVKAAKTHFEKSVQLVPLPVNLTNLGIAYRKEGDIKSAKKYFEQALAIEGGSFVTYEAIADLLLTYESATAAASFSEKAVVIFPYNSKLWMTLAMARYQLGDDQEAADAAKKAVTFMSNEDYVHLQNELRLQ